MMIVLDHFVLHVIDLSNIGYHTQVDMVDDLEDNMDYIVDRFVHFVFVAVQSISECFPIVQPLPKIQMALYMFL